MNRTFLLPLSALALGATACSGESDTGNDDTDTTPDTEVDTEADTEEDTEADTDADTDAEATFTGEWEATSLTDYANDTYAMPYSYSYTYGGINYAETRSMSLTVSAGSVGLTDTYDYVNTENGVEDAYSESTTYTGSWSGAAAPVYALTFEDADLNMDCTLAGDDLECVGTADDPQFMRISFDRAAAGR